MGPVVILADGPWDNPKDVKHWTKPGSLIIACDGAYRKAKRIGIKVDVLIGDLENVARHEVGSGVRIFAYPSEKDETDAELAFHYALDRKPSEIFFLGALGGRWDHTLANIFLMTQAAAKGVPVHLVCGAWRLHVVLSHWRFDGRLGDRVSLIPLTRRVDGIRTAGLKYALKGASLFFDRTRGTSNVMIKREAEVHVKRGWLLVTHERRRS